MAYSFGVATLSVQGSGHGLWQGGHSHVVWKPIDSPPPGRLRPAHQLDRACSTGNGTFIREMLEGAETSLR